MPKELLAIAFACEKFKTCVYGSQVSMDSGQKHTYGTKSTATDAAAPPEISYQDSVQERHRNVPR